MFEKVIGDWPTHERVILTSCDEQYFREYFPRFYKTYTEHWQIPLHIHVIDPTEDSLTKLQRLGVSYTHCETDANILKWPYSYVTYCQAQRFILAGYKMRDNQTITLADIDSYALRTPTALQRERLGSAMAFTEYNDRLMATFCTLHHSERALVKHAAEKMKALIQNTDTLGVDQLVLKEVFGKMPYNLLTHGEWIRHRDVKTAKDLLRHNKCLIYHEKGTRGKGKGVKIEWTDIGL